MPEITFCPWFRYYERQTGDYVCWGGRKDRMPTVDSEVRFRARYCNSYGYKDCSLYKHLCETWERQPKLMTENTKTRDWDAEVEDDL